MWSIATPGKWRAVSDRRWLAGLVGVAIVALHPLAARPQFVPLVVRGVSFTGNHAVEADVLAASIVTTQSAFFQSNGVARTLTFGQLGDKRMFNETEFVGDVYRVRIVYILSGYPDAKVDTTVKRTPGAVRVTFHITEGTPVRLQNVDVVGLDSVANAWQVRLDLPIAAGDVASDYKLHETRDTIESRLRNRGYPAATVDFVEQEHGPTENARFEVHTGGYSRFGPITVRGPLGTDAGFVASLIAARPGDEFRMNQITQSQRTLYTSDLFRFATVSIDSTWYNTRPGVVPLTVVVLPSAGHQARASVGYGTDACFRAGLGWTARNFPGTGLVFDVTGQLSKIGVGDPLGLGFEKTVCAQLQDDSVGSRVANYGVNASLRRNAFLSPNNSAVLSIFATRHSEFEVYLREEVGASFSVTHNTAANVPITLSYRIADGTTSANPASFCAFFNTCEPSAIAALRQRRLQGTLSLSVQRTRVNNPLDPYRGSILTASVTTSSRFLGSSASQQFTRFIGDASGFLPVSRGIVLAGHLRAGIIMAPVTDIGQESGTFVPPDQRFYAGGANDVRGYDQNQLGPLVYVIPTDSIRHLTAPAPHDSFPSSAARVAPTGGTRVVNANIELRMPTPFFAGRLRFAAFVDAGALWNAGGQAPLRITPGVGLRYTSPLGPIRFDVGYNRYDLQSGPLYEINADGTLKPLLTDFLKERTRSWTLHFSIGQAF